MKPFNKKYRQLLSQDAPKAPDDVWKNISSQLDLDAAKMRLNAEDKELIEEAWIGIENQLDIDQVWGNISKELDKEELKATGFKIKLPYWVAAAILLLLLMGDTSLVQYLSNTLDLNYIADVQVQQDQDSVKVKLPSGSDILSKETNNLWPNGSEKNSTSIAIASSSDLTTKGLNAIDESKEHIRNENHNDRFAKSSAGNVLIDDDNPQNRIVNHQQVEPLGRVSGEISIPYLTSKDARVDWQQEFKHNLKPLLSDSKTKNDFSIDELDFTFPTDKEIDLLASNKRYSPWSTGIVTSIKNTYLLNAETKDGFSPSGMNESKITVLPDVGLNVQYAINQRYILSSNLFLSSSLKQNYNTYNYGEYVSKQFKLSYLAGEFAVKQSSKYNIFGSDKVIRRNIAGFYVAALQSASETLAQEKTDISSKYTALDYGVLLGQEIEIVSRGPIKVSTGLTVKYGLPNVYAGDSSLPGNLNQTHNVSFEFRVGIAYHWKTKKDFDNFLSFLTGR